MARTQPSPPFSAVPATTTLTAAGDPYFDLGRLLSRLDQNLLRADGDKWRRLATDEFQRLQARFDVAAARTLLTRAEQDHALSMKGHIGRRPDRPDRPDRGEDRRARQDRQAELSRCRMLVERLQERLDNLDEEAAATAAMGAEEEEEEENNDVVEGMSSTSTVDDVLAHVIRTPSRSTDSRSAGEGETGGESAAAAANRPEAAPSDSLSIPEQGKKTRRKRPARARMAARSPASTAGVSETAAAATVTATATTTITATPTSPPSPPPPQATLRARGNGGQQSARSDTALTTSAQVASAGSTPLSLSASRSLLLGVPSSSSPATAAAPSLATEEAILDQHRREQEALSVDILRLAQALKQKSLATSRLLEDDKDVVDRVGDGLHKTNENLAAAGRSMALLTRMTEGKGWWGRMLLFGMIYGMMVLLVLMFLFLPKLRF